MQIYPAIVLDIHEQYEPGTIRIVNAFRIDLTAKGEFLFEGYHVESLDDLLAKMKLFIHEMGYPVNFVLSAEPGASMKALNRMLQGIIPLIPNELVIVDSDWWRQQ